MKNCSHIFLSLFLLLGQWSVLEHSFHDHDFSEVCDQCLSIKKNQPIGGVEYKLTTPDAKFHVANYVPVVNHSASKPNYFSVRAPPKA